MNRFHKQQQRLYLPAFGPKLERTSHRSLSSCAGWLCILLAQTITHVYEAPSTSFELTHPRLFPAQTLFLHSDQLDSCSFWDTQSRVNWIIQSIKAQIHGFKSVGIITSPMWKHHRGNLQMLHLILFCKSHRHCTCIVLFEMVALCNLDLESTVTATLQTSTQYTSIISVKETMSEVKTGSQLQLFSHRHIEIPKHGQTREQRMNHRCAADTSLALWHWCCAEDMQAENQ